MKKLLPLLTLFIASVLLPGCSPSNPPTELATPIPTSKPTLLPANVTCNELSFYLDPLLGDGYACETVPESSSSDIPIYYVFIYPAHTELTIQNYPLTRTQFPSQIWIYPVSRFSELLPDYFPPRLSELQRLIASDTWGNGVLPFLPANPQIQTFHIHETALSFQGGKGFRFITDYSDGPMPISNRNILYTFQGLTDDGKYWVAVTLPISSPILPADDTTLPEGYTQESLMLNYSSYASQVRDALAGQAPGSFFPTLDSLDSLVRSITIGQ
jgi:hypothetical protein